MKALLLPIIEQAVISGVLNKKSPFMRKNKLGFVLLVVSGLFLIVTTLFLIIAGYGLLLENYTQPIAAFIMSSIIFLTAIIAGVAGGLLLKKKPENTMQPDEILAMVSDISDLIGQELEQPIKDNPKTAMLLASVAGVMAGDRLN